MRKFLFSIMILVATYCNAQRVPIAPNFSITDSVGNTFNLYEDALDQGKICVINFFGATCGTCIDAVPKYNDYYTDYGQNQDDVIFIAIEKNLNTSDASVYNFHDQTGSIYPMYNETSEDSVSILMGATYTPKYYVICPNRTYITHIIDSLPTVITYCESIVGLEDEELENVSFNYFDGKISLQSKLFKQVNLTVYSVDGKLVLDRKQSVNHFIPFELQNGLYIYLIKNKNGKLISSGKFIH